MQNQQIPRNQDHTYAVPLESSYIAIDEPYGDEVICVILQGKHMIIQKKGNKQKQFRMGSVNAVPILSLSLSLSLSLALSLSLSLLQVLVVT